MTSFQYQGRDSQGQKVSGALEGASKEAIAGQLINRGVTPLLIEEASAKEPSLSDHWREWRNGGNVKPEELIMFCRQMYTITKAGIPLIRGIRGLSATVTQLRLQRALDDIADRLETGIDLSSCMKHHPTIFNRLFISLINVGENSGQLEQSFLQLSEYIERDLESSKRVKSALRYPSFVILAMVFAIGFVNVQVIPKFAGMFERFGAELPLPTQILMGISNFFVNYWLYLVAMIGVGVYALIRYLKTEKGAEWWGYKKLHFPAVGDIVERASMGRYARTFGLMQKSGLPLPQALELCSQAIDNPYLSKKILAIRDGVQRGESLYQTHQNSGMFTPLVMQMIAVGEESGQVDSLLFEVAEFYEREVEYDLKKIADRIEPILIVMMAALVLVLALGIFLPMWSMLEIQR